MDKQPNQPNKPNAQAPVPPSEYEQWQAEEVARLNAMADHARKMGIIIPTGCGDSPALNPDGSLAQVAKPASNA